MITLHRVTDVSKKVIIGFGIGILAIIFLVIVFNIGGAIKELFFPTPAAPPTVSFGKLGEFAFPKSITDTQFHYTLNTVSGSLPDLGDRIIVYKLQQPQPNLIAIDQIKAIANKAGFEDNPVAVTESLFSWENITTSQKMTMNSVTFDFTFTLENYLTNDQVLKATNLPDQNEAIDFAKSFLQNIMLLPTDIDTSKTTTSLFLIKNGAITPATSLSEAQLIRVDYFQNDINDLSLYYPHATESLMHVMIGSAEKQPQVVNAQMVHRTVLTDFNATYPIKSTQQAFDELKKNKGYIAAYTGTDENIVIRNISLGYYIGEASQGYTIPIIVFQGDNNFFAYVTAVTDEWLGK